MRRAKHRFFPKSPFYKQSEGGFSIIELSIILALFAFVIANAFIVGAARKELKNVVTSYENMEVVKQAIDAFLRAKGRLPCPADGRVHPTDENLGTETCNIDPQNNTDGLFIASTGKDFNKIYIGVVPTKTLGLASTFMLDRWGNRITYAVVANLTAENGYDAAIQGNIMIYTPERQLSQKASYAIISHGENGVGAWNFTGASRVQSPVTGVYDGGELENHHMDPAEPWDNEFHFITRPPDDTTGHQMIFDDIILWDYVYNISMPDEEEGFMPPDIPELVLWLDATDESTIEKDEFDHVLRWRDKTTIYNNQGANDAVATDVAHFPTFLSEGNNSFALSATRNLNAIHFSQNENDALTVTDDASLNHDNLKHMTIFVVANSNSDDNPNRKMFLGRGISFSDDPLESNAWGFGSITPIVANDVRGFWMHDHLNAFNSAEFSNNLGFYDTPRIWVAKYDGGYWHFGLIKYYEDCNTRAQEVYTAPSLVPANGAPIIIGSQYIDGALNGIYSLEGDIGEVIIYSAPLNDFDRERVTRYLAEKWQMPTNKATCTLAQPQCLPGTETLSAACTVNSDCCSGQCSAANTCCMPTGYTGGWERCNHDADCCDAAATCTLSGFCWREILTP